MTQAEDVINQTLRAGRSTISAEEAIGLRGRKRKKKKPKESRLKRLARAVKMGFLGPHYKTDFMKRKGL